MKALQGYRKQTGLTPAAVAKGLPDQLDKDLKSAMPDKVAAPAADPADKPTRARTGDALSDAIGHATYYYKMGWDWFKKEVAPGFFEKMTVSRYYPHANVALDMKLGVGEDDPKDLKLKEKILADKGIKYFVLKDDVDVKRMLKAIGRPT